MRRQIAWMASLLLLLTLLLSGCAAEPATPEAAAATARAFMLARVSGDAGAVEALMTSRALRATSQEQIRLLLRPTTTFDGLGSPTEVEPGVVRIPVQGLTLTSPERSVRWPESWLTLRREGDRWRVAWAEPLMYEATQSYMNGLYNVDLGHEIVAIDPYHYRGYLELHFVYRGLKRYREAEVAINSAMERATAAQLPDVHDAMARFKLTINAPGEALAHARRALELAAPYVPATYSARWQADTLVVAGRAALASHDQAAAAALAGEAAALDPDNANLAIFRHQLAAKPSVPSTGR